MLAEKKEVFVFFDFLEWKSVRPPFPSSLLSFGFFFRSIPVDFEGRREEETFEMSRIPRFVFSSFSVLFSRQCLYLSLPSLFGRPLFLLRKILLFPTEERKTIVK